MPQNYLKCSEDGAVGSSSAVCIIRLFVETLVASATGDARVVVFSQFIVAAIATVVAVEFRFILSKSLL